MLFVGLVQELLCRLPACCMILRDPLLDQSLGMFVWSLCQEQAHVQAHRLLVRAAPTEMCRSTMFNPRRGGKVSALGTVEANIEPAW